ncbi:MAG: class I SAM-dependent methyltransferase [Pseudomonadota bacterium]
MAGADLARRLKNKASSLLGLGPGRAAPVPPPEPMAPGKVIEKTRLILLKTKTWRYLRYLHFREALQKVDGEISSVCICGAGHGYAELALAAEFPHIHFTLTDIVNKEHGYPNYHATMDMAWKWGVNNISFGVWNVLEPTHRRFDLIASTEMLEHIEDAKTAARNMRKTAERYVYCLVPFADATTNANPQKRKGAWERHEHFVCGYDADEMKAMFPDPVLLTGTYWADTGLAFRMKLNEMSPEEIEAQFGDLQREAETDISDRVPLRSKEAQGIKILSRV